MQVRWKYFSFFIAAGILVTGLVVNAEKNSSPPVHINTFDRTVVANSNQMVAEGRQTFRFDTFGDEAFWGGQLQLHKAIEGAKFGGVGPGVSPATAAAVGLKIDADALPQSIISALKAGQVNLNDPAVTLALLKLNSVVGLTGDFNPDGSLKSVGIQCALCHSRVDNSFKAPGLPEGIVGHRLDGWPNQDLNVGAIVSLAPNLQAVADLLGVNVATVQKVLMSWGPGKFDAELFLDGKGFNPKQVTDGVVTGTNVTGAVLIPPAFGKAGVNLHTWTGAWGTVSYWNAFVAVLEMHGQGTFFDPRLDNAAQFPIAAAHNFGHVSSNPDLVTAKLPALHFYQLAIPAPQPLQGSFNQEAATRGDELFGGKAKCTTCHTEPLWTEPGWNLHAGSDVCIDNFEADRAPDHKYRTTPLGGLWTHQKRGFYHDGRFATLMDVVNHYDSCLSLGLTSDEKSDLVEYLKSLPGAEETTQ